MTNLDATFRTASFIVDYSENDLNLDVTLTPVRGLGVAAVTSDNAAVIDVVVKKGPFMALCCCLNSVEVNSFRSRDEAILYALAWAAHSFNDKGNPFGFELADVA